MRVIIISFLCVITGCTASTDKRAQTTEQTPATASTTDPLPSWNDGPVKNSIISYVKEVTDEKGQHFIPVIDRIATFDNDGTLWSEQPVYFQFFYALDKVKSMAPGHPEWKNKEPFKSVLSNDMGAVMKQGEHGILEIVAATHAGMTTTQFDSAVRQWIDTALHPTKKKRYNELVYQPMLELIRYLQDHQFQTFIVSGGGIDFMRAWAENVYGIPKDQIIGSSIKAKYDYANGHPVITKLAELDFIDDHDGKPVGIQKFIGRKPVFAAGNSDGDLQMLQWTASNNYKNLELYVHHTDSTREWAYDRQSAIGKLDKGLDEAQQKKWLIADMKNDWKTIFPLRNSAVPLATYKSPGMNGKRRNHVLPVLFLLILSFASLPVSAQKADSIRQTDSLKYSPVKYGPKGFEFRTADNKFLLQVQSRMQFRFATPEDQDPVTFDDFSGEKNASFSINRARLKVGGHAFKPWLKYYWEYELSQSNLLNYTIMIEKWEWLNFQVGQWKVEYNRERRISSGEQQMVDRSVINRAFTVDRQQGVEIYGRLRGKGCADFNYWLAAVTGTGRGNRENDDSRLMYFGRLQWNFTGQFLDFEGSDLEIHQHPAGEIAVSAVTNRSPYTRFSQAGGGELEGYEDGKPGQYKVNQANFETAFKYKGFSWQSEVHWKQIIDKVNNDHTDDLHGYYVEAGYFFHQAINWWPRPLEVAVRNAGYMPNREADQTKKRETSMATNWFFNGHKNKLTAEVSYFNYDKTGDIPASEWRFRLQWDISL